MNIEPHGPSRVQHSDLGGSRRPPYAEDSAIRSFFRDKNVLITGGSGFIGKVLIEKLLRSCPNVGTIFVLLRPHRKSGKSAHQRMKEEIVGSKCFEKLRALHPELTKKLRAVQGDVAAPGLGIQQGNLQEIEDKVNVVFHCAATVKFNEHLKTAFEINVDGVSSVVALCRRIRRLDVLVHVSTAYVNATEHSGLRTLHEDFKKLQFDHQSLRKRIREMSMEDVAGETEKILRSCGGWPNTYTLTKCIGELALRDEGGDIPSIVVRPSIVTCADREPAPGWIDSLVGPAGLVLAVALGALHVVPGNEKLIVDFIPVDIAVNTLLASAWHAGRQASSETAVKIVHCATSGPNPITWEFMLKAMPPYYDRHPTNKKIGPVYFKWAKSDFEYWILHNLWHKIPAAWMDLQAVLAGSKGGNFKKMQWLMSAVSALTFFTQHEWRFDVKNAQTIQQALPWGDQEAFNMEPKSIVWDTYFTTWSHGMKLYLLGEQPVYVETRSRL